MRNWNPSSIFDIRENTGFVKVMINGKEHHYAVYLRAGGWDIGPGDDYTRLDIWTACRVLNDFDAELVRKTENS
jgi:hypothetical protein